MGKFTSHPYFFPGITKKNVTSELLLKKFMPSLAIFSDRPSVAVADFGGTKCNLTKKNYEALKKLDFYTWICCKCIKKI